MWYDFYANKNTHPPRSDHLVLRPQALFPYAPPAVPREYGELNQKPGWLDGILSHLWFMEYMIPPSHMLIIGVLTHPHISMLSGHIYIYIIYI